MTHALLPLCARGWTGPRIRFRDRIVDVDGSVADRWGRLSAADPLLRLLQRRFGPVAESARARVADGSAAEIDAWFDALLDAQSLTEVFDARPQ